MSTVDQPIRTRLICQDAVSERLPFQVASALAREGIELDREARDPACPFGVILFERDSQELLEKIRESSLDGLDRLLVLSSSKAALAGATPWRLRQAGASDVLAWDGSPNSAAAIAARFRRWQAIDEFVQSPMVRETLVGRSRAWTVMLRQVVEVARYTDASVLVMGESGTGKELVARLIHALGDRPDQRPLVVLDCATVVPELSGSEFFGHERGAFTHAYAARDGAFALADGGTLFLDEIGELPPALQAELLRVVQERVYKRVGSNAWRQTNFRLVCATNRDLLAEEARGRFRRDLYYRIAGWTFTLPPLRERREDVLPLARHFLREVLGADTVPDFDPSVRDYLLVRDYPGNIRELRQLIHRVARCHVGEGPITIGDFPEDELGHARRSLERDWRDGELELAVRRALAQGVGLREFTVQAAEVAVRIALADEDGNLHRAALRLQVTDRALQMRRAAHPRADGDKSSASALGPETEPTKAELPPPPPRDRTPP